MQLELTNLNLWGQRLNNIGIGVLRYGLAFLLIFIGGMKFFKFEADDIKTMVYNSPFLGWMYSILSVQNVSIVFGVFEIIAGLLILSRRFSPKISVIGSLMTIPMFVVTLSFLFSTPGKAGTDSSGFLIKDIILLGAGIMTAGEALLAVYKKKIRC